MIDIIRSKLAQGIEKLMGFGEEPLFKNKIEYIGPNIILRTGVKIEYEMERLREDVYNFYQFSLQGYADFARIASMIMGKPPDILKEQEQFLATLDLAVPLELGLIMDTSELLPEEIAYFANLYRQILFASPEFKDGRYHVISPIATISLNDLLELTN